MPVASPKPKYKRNFFILALSIGLILFLVTTWKSNPISILKTLRIFTFWHFITIICTFLLQFLFAVITLALIIKRLNHKIALRSLFPLQLINFSICYITPFSNNGGEPLFIYLLKKKYQVPYSKATAAIILEIILRLAVSLFLMAFGCIYFFLTVNLPVIKAIFLVTLLFFLFLVTLFFCTTAKRIGCLTLLGKHFGLNSFKFFQRKQKIIANIDKCTIHFFHHYPKDFALTVLLAFLGVSCFVARFYLILLFLGYAAGFLDIVLVFSLSQALILAPIPTLLGIHEVGQGLISLVTSIPLGTGISFVIILRVVSLMMTIPGFILLGQHSLNIVGKRLRDRIFFTPYQSNLK